MTYIPRDDRYDQMTYNRCGRSGLRLPAISLGLWHNFGHDTPHTTKQAICRTAFDHGITHFDLANNYGPPAGSAEEAFGELLRTDFSSHRDELIISSKAGYHMWNGPYGEWGSRKYVNSQRTREAVAILNDLGTPLLIHQPSYNILNRWVETDGLKDTLAELGVGSIAFVPLAQGILTNKYLNGIPQGSRATQGKSLDPKVVEKAVLSVKKLHEMAEARGQTLAQMALAWVLRRGGITSALIGASKPEQVVDCVGAIRNLDFTDQELAQVDAISEEKDINLWARSSED